MWCIISGLGSLVMLVIVRSGSRFDGTLGGTSQTHIWNIQIQWPRKFRLQL